MAWRTRHRIAPAALLLIIVAVAIGSLFFILKPTDPQAAVVGLDDLAEDQVACQQVFELELGELETFTLRGDDHEIGIMEIHEIGSFLSSIKIWLNGGTSDLSVGESIYVNEDRDLIYIGIKTNEEIEKKEAILCLVQSS